MRRLYIAVRILFFLFLLIPAHFSSGQLLAYGNDERGFILDNSGDRVEGFFPEMDAYERTRHLLFIPEGKTEPQRLGIDDFTYAETISGEKLKPFPQSVSGSAIGGFIGTKMYDTDIKLYSARSQSSVRHFYVINRDGAALYLSPQRYQLQLRSVFGDCSGVVRDYWDINEGYTVSYMTRLFSEYDRCMSGEVIRRGVRFGVITGFNSSNMSVTSSNNIYQGVAFGYLPGFTFGVYLDVPVWRDKVYFKPEVLYTSRGGETSVPFPGPSPGLILLTDDELNASFRYAVLNLPVRYEISVLGVNAYVSGGAMLGWLVSGEATASRLIILDDSEDDEAFVFENEILEADDDISFGLNAGVGVRMPLGPVDLFAEGRYSRIVSNLGFQSATFRTTALEVLVGFSF